jgi:cytochrome c-type biogenesis protein CcmH/NrfG
MSFPLVCPNCGAPSSPSAGVCPFCKAVAALPLGSEAPGLTAIQNAYRDGNLPRALSLCAALESQDSKIVSNVEYLLSYAKILIETEGPSTKIKSLLGKAFAISPENVQVAEYLEIIEAKSMLTPELNDGGERQLANVLRRSPNNVHALFILGAHLFWASADSVSAIRYLERCVSLYPKFLRAWGCLGAIYEKLGNAALAARAYRICSSLETEPNMKAFFDQKIAQAST